MQEKKINLKKEKKKKIKFNSRSYIPSLSAAKKLCSHTNLVALFNRQLRMSEAKQNSLNE